MAVTRPALRLAPQPSGAPAGSSRRRGVISPRALVALALLDERPMHPYEIQQVIRTRAICQVVQVTQGSLYHAVEKLSADGLIEPVETSREGRRPERTVYAITDRGRDTVRLELIDLLATFPAERPAFVTALSLARLLTPAEVSEALRQRAVALEAFVAAYQSVVESLADQGLDRVSVIEVEYAREMARAEISWVGALRADLDSGRLTWRSHAVTDGPILFHH